MASDQAQTSVNPPATRLFYTLAAAEDAFRQEPQRNDVLSAKLDENFDKLERTMGEKLDSIVSLLERLLTNSALAPPVPAPVPSVTPPFKYESTPAPPLAPPKFDTTPFKFDPSLGPQIAMDPPTTGLRPLNLFRSQSDPVPDRRQFMQRDRSIPPQSLNPMRIPVEPFLNPRRTRSPSPQPKSRGDAKPIVGVKLPNFRGKYTDNVHAWLAIIRDRFHLHKTPDDEKIANISALFKDDALVWYLDLQKKYPHRAPTWEEFEMELDVKFAQNPVRISWLRRLLKFIEYNGPQDMERYVSEFRSIEIQISDYDMAFGDRLNYFLETFNVLDPTLKLQIQDLHPRQMEIAYDAALNFAWSRIEKQEREKGGPETIKRSIVRDPVVRFTDVSKSSSKKPSAETDSDSDDLNIMNGNLRVCFRCQQPGHFAEKCLAPHPVPRSKQPTGSTDKHSQSTDKHSRFSRVVKYQPNEKGQIEEKVFYLRMDSPPSVYDSDSDDDDRYLYCHGMNPRSIYDSDYNSEYDMEDSDSEPPAGVYTIPGGGFMDSLYPLR